MIDPRDPVESAVSDDEVIARVLAGDKASFEIVMRRYNQRLYRAARALLRDDLLAEDLVQEAWVRAYQHLGQFAGRSSFSTWLLRITINEGLARARAGQRYSEPREGTDAPGGRMDRFISPVPDPEQQASTSEMRVLLEGLIDRLPDANRAVFMLRDVEGLSTSEAAEVLSISEENVKVRLHRARAALRDMLMARVGMQYREAFGFLGDRCDRIVKQVFERIGD